MEIIKKYRGKATEAIRGITLHQKDPESKSATAKEEQING